MLLWSPQSIYKNYAHRWHAIYFTLLAKPSLWQECSDICNFKDQIHHSIFKNPEAVCIFNVAYCTNTYIMIIVNSISLGNWAYLPWDEPTCHDNASSDEPLAWWCMMSPWLWTLPWPLMWKQQLEWWGFVHRNERIWWSIWERKHKEFL